MPIKGTVWEEGASGNDPKQRKKIETYQNTAVHGFGHYLELEHPRYWIDSKNPNAYGRTEKERRAMMGAGNVVTKINIKGPDGKPHVHNDLAPFLKVVEFLG